jgi:hypothetical protein
VIETGAEIGSGCRIGPCAVIGSGVVIGPDCRIGTHASLSHALLGARVYVIDACQALKHLGRIHHISSIEVSCSADLFRSFLNARLVPRIENLGQRKPGRAIDYDGQPSGTRRASRHGRTEID